MNPIKVVIVDDNERILNLLDQILSEDPDIKVTGRAKDGLNAVDIIRSAIPDVVLLDMIMPNLDGIGVMETILKGEYPLKKPQFIVVSAVGHERLTDQAFAAGASYYIMKPINPDVILQKIHKIYDENNGNIVPVLVQTVSEEITEYDSSMLEEHVTATLHELGVPANIMGYQYLRDAIIMAIENREAVNAVTKILYPTVAKMHSTTGSRVERAIRHAVEKVWIGGNRYYLRRFFGDQALSSKKQPSNSEFIAQIADLLRYDYRHNPNSVLSPNR